jgi:hypothetical protein
MDNDRLPVLDLLQKKGIHIYCRGKSFKCWQQSQNSLKDQSLRRRRKGINLIRIITIFVSLPNPEIK